MKVAVRLRNIFFICMGLSISACTHLHSDLLPNNFTNHTVTSTQNNKPKIQVIVTRGLIYYTHSAIRVQTPKQTLFWDPSGSYASDEHEEYFKENPLPSVFVRKKDLITLGAPDLETYWLFAKYTDDTGMEVFEWDLTDKSAMHYQSILLAGANEADNKYEFDSQDTFLLCSSALTRFLDRFITQAPLGETFFFPDSLAHKLYTLNPSRIILFEKGGPIQVYQR